MRLDHGLFFEVKQLKNFADWKSIKKYIQRLHLCARFTEIKCLPLNAIIFDVGFMIAASAETL